MFFNWPISKTKEIKEKLIFHINRIFLNNKYFFFRFYFMLSLGKKIDSFKKKCFFIETGPY